MGANTPSLADLLAKGPEREVFRCKLGGILTQLDQADADALRSALAMAPRQGGFSLTELEATLKAVGYQVGTSTISRHRGGQCGCPQDA